LIIFISSALFNQLGIISNCEIGLIL